MTAPYLSTVICERVYKILPPGQRAGKGSPGASLSHSMGRCVSTTWRIRGKEGLARGERKSKNRKTPDSEFKGGVPNCAGMTSWNQFGQLELTGAATTPTKYFLEPVQSVAYTELSGLANF